MDDRDAVAALIDRLVAASGLPRGRARDDLRRELASHFDEAGDAPDSLRAAMERFGSPDAVGGELRRAYGRGRRALYAAKVVASAVAAAAAALLLQLPLAVRVEAAPPAVAFGPGFAITACFSIAMAIVAVAAWEIGIEPLCTRLEGRPLVLLAALGGYFAAMQLVHLAAGTPVRPELALTASGAAVAAWTATIAILARFDLAFLRLLGPRRL